MIKVISMLITLFMWLSVNLLALNCFLTGSNNASNIPCLTFIVLIAVTFSRIDPGGKLVMGFRKAPIPGDMQVKLHKRTLPFLCVFLKY